jgi:spermidine synthase
MILSVEILGARMLSPYMGSSHFVWTAQIAVTLGALATGYYAGGRLADGRPRIPYLFAALLGAGIWLGLTAVLLEPVAYLSLQLPLSFAALAASAALFFVPLALLGMTGPFVIRMITSAVSEVGTSVGLLTAVSTFSSFLGTVLIGYLLIPLLPNSTTMILCAAVLVGLCAVFYLGWNRKLLPLTVLAAASILIVGLFAGHRRDPVYRLVTQVFAGNSHFGYIQVLDRRTSPIRYFLNDNLMQNAYDLERKQSPLGFSYMLTGLPRLYSTNIENALVIGMGVGIVPMDLARSGTRVETVEINAAVVKIAERYFDFDPAKVSVIIGDGRHILNKLTNTYDLIIMDAFVGDSAPSHLLTRETFLSAKRLLRPGGTLVVHSFGDLAPGHDFQVASLSKTLRHVFAGVRTHTDGEGAFFFVARMEDRFEPLRKPSLEGVHPDAREGVEKAFSGPVEIPAGSGMVLTDDYNPIDYYEARNREALRRRLALTARNM